MEKHQHASSSANLGVAANINRTPEVLITTIIEHIKRTDLDRTTALEDLVAKQSSTWSDDFNKQLTSEVIKSLRGSTPTLPITLESADQIVVLSRYLDDNCSTQLLKALKAKVGIKSRLLDFDTLKNFIRVATFYKLEIESREDRGQILNDYAANNLKEYFINALTALANKTASYKLPFASIWSSVEDFMNSCSPSLTKTQLERIDEAVTNLPFPVENNADLESYCHRQFISFQRILRGYAPSILKSVCNLNLPRRLKSTVQANLAALMASDDDYSQSANENQSMQQVDTMCRRLERHLKLKIDQSNPDSRQDLEQLQVVLQGYQKTIRAFKCIQGTIDSIQLATNDQDKIIKALAMCLVENFYPIVEWEEDIQDLRKLNDYLVGQDLRPLGKISSRYFILIRSEQYELIAPVVKSLWSIVRSFEQELRITEEPENRTALANIMHACSTDFHFLSRLFKNITLEELENGNWLKRTIQLAHSNGISHRDLAKLSGLVLARYDQLEFKLKSDRLYDLVFITWNEFDVTSEMR